MSPAEFPLELLPSFRAFRSSAGEERKERRRENLLLGKGFDFEGIERRDGLKLIRLLIHREDTSIE